MRTSCERHVNWANTDTQAEISGKEEADLETLELPDKKGWIQIWTNLEWQGRKVDSTATKSVLC